MIEKLKEYPTDPYADIDTNLFLVTDNQCEIIEKINEIIDNLNKLDKFILEKELDK